MDNDDLYQKIESLINVILDEKIYYAMKGMKLRNITPAQIRAVKVFIVYRRLGIEWLSVATCETFMKATSTHSILHLLGDKRVLLLKRGPKNLQYSLDPVFLNHLSPELFAPITQL